MEKLASEYFNEAVKNISKEIKTSLLCVDDKRKSDCSEIRLRVNRPVALIFTDGTYYLEFDGKLSKNFKKGVVADKEILKDTFSRFCEYSLYVHQYDISNGFVTLEGGHRVGISGTSIIDSYGNISNVKDISSLNLRIAKEINVCNDIVYNNIADKSIIIAGPPASGKTTFLRDYIKRESNRGVNVSLVDERQEIACVKNGIPQMDVGANTDIYCSYPKVTAVNMALRTMSPALIAVDEVCENNELTVIKYASNCGVRLVASVHIAGYEDIFNRIQMLSLIKTGAFEKIVLLKTEGINRSVDVFNIEEINDEIYRRSIYMDKLFFDRDKELDAI